MVASLCRRAGFAMAFVLLGAVWFAAPSSADENAPLDLACAAETLPSDPDASAEVTLPFEVDTGDADPKTSVWISENGHLAFDGDPGPWFPVFDLADLSFPNFDVIAPLYADASQGANGSVTYGATEFEGRSAFCVNWIDLEPNNEIANIPLDPIPTNTFQVVLIERLDRGAGAFDIVTNYESVGWDDSFCQLIPIPEDFAAAQGPGDACCPELVQPSAAAQGPGCCDIEFEGPCCDINFDGPCCDFQLQECCDFGDGILVPCEELGPPCDINGPCCDVEIEECCDIGDGLVLPCDEIPQAAAQAFPVFPEGQSVAGVSGVSFPAVNEQGFNVGRTVEFAGSGIIDGMIDPDGLSATSLNSLQAGRHVVEVDEGFAGAVGSVAGAVELEDGSPVVDGLVWVCGGPDLDEEPFDVECAFTRTDANGQYALDGVPLGEYEVTARGPAGTDLFDATEFVSVQFQSFANAVDTIVLFGPEPPAENVAFGPTNSWGAGTSVYYRDDLDVAITGCVGGTASWTVSSNNGTSTGPMAEGPDGTYSGVIPALFPAHGNADVSIELSCQDPTEDQDASFPIYIDPSGTVLELQSGEPIEGVTVVLERRDPGAVAFTVVPDGDEIMSLSNRQNPFQTLADGRFGWDVVAGEYRVTVSKAGCASIALPADWADQILTNVGQIIGVPDASATPILQVLPEWLGLELFLDCNNAPTIDDPGPITLPAPVAAGDLPDPSVDDLDPADVAGLVITNDAPAELPLGDTDVTWTVTDPSGAAASIVQTITVTAPVDDDDNDGVLNDVDECPGTVLPDLDIVDVAGDRYIATDAGFVDANGTVIFGLDATRGCSGQQILAVYQPSAEFEEATTGLRLSTIETWIFQCTATAGVLTWDDAQDDVPYWIYQSLDDGASFSFLASVTAGLTYEVPNPQVGALYQVHYQGIDRVDCAIDGEPDPGGAPFACQVDAGAVSWSDDAQSKYWVYKSVDGGATYSWIGRTEGAISFTDPSPTVNALYQVHYAGIPRVDCTIINEPPAPPLFSCSSDAGVLTWTTGAPTPTWVYRSLDDGATYNWIGRSLDAPTFTDPDPVVGALYQVHYAGIPRTDCVIVSEPPEGMAFSCSVSNGEITWPDQGQERTWIYKSVDDGATYVWIGRTLAVDGNTFIDPAPTADALYQAHYAGIPRANCIEVADAG